MNFGKLLLVGLTSLTITPSSWALVGGPWDHLIKDIYSRANSDGLYEASITMKNGSGFLRFVSATDRDTLASAPAITTTGTITPTNTGANFSFSQSSQSLASQSNAVVFYRGTAYFGSVYGSVNAQSKAVNGGGGGQASIMGDLLTAAEAAAEQVDAFVNIRGFSESMNIFFDGRVVRDVPEIRFEAKGEAVFFSRPNLKITQVPFDFPPLIIGGGGGGGQTTVTLPDPVYTIEVDSPGIVEPDATLKIRLFGGRVSLQTTFNAPTATVGAGGAAGN